MTTLTSFFKTDGVDDHVANDVNVLIAAALRPEYANTETISATKTLTDNDCQFQFLTASAADRTVKLAPEATSNHVTVIYNSGATYNVVVQDDSATYTFATLAPDEWLVFLPANAEGWRAWSQPEEKYKLSVTVASNNLTVAIKHLDGTDPTPTRPLVIKINSTKRYITAALSVTKNAGTNWANLGAAETATLENSLFVYLIWNTTPGTDIMDIGFSRIPYGLVYSDFSTTTTNEKYLAFANASTPTSTDDVVNIGRFNATLSAGAGYTWSVPTFTNANLIQTPCYETLWTTYTPTVAGFSSNPTGTVYQYKLIMNEVYVRCRQGTNGTSNATTFTLTAPFTAMTLTNGVWIASCIPSIDNGTTATTPGSVYIQSASATLNVCKNTDLGATAWTNVNGKRVGFFQLQYPLA